MQATLRNHLSSSTLTALGFALLAVFGVYRH
jgi:hypothetical protein